MPNGVRRFGRFSDRGGSLPEPSVGGGQWTASGTFEWRFSLAARLSVAHRKLCCDKELLGPNLLAAPCGGQHRAIEKRRFERAERFQPIGGTTFSPQGVGFQPAR